MWISWFISFILKADGRKQTRVRDRDSESLLKWLSKDRAAIGLLNAYDLKSKQGAFEKLLRRWIRFVQSQLRASLLQLTRT